MKLIGKEEMDHGAAMAFSFATNSPKTKLGARAFRVRRMGRTDGELEAEAFRLMEEWENAPDQG